MVVGVRALASTDAAERVALPGPVAAFAEARLAGVARGDVGGAVAEDVLAVVVEAARPAVQPACGCWNCGRLQQQRQRRGGHDGREHHRVPKEAREAPQRLDHATPQIQSQPDQGPRRRR